MKQTFKLLLVAHLLFALAPSLLAQKREDTYHFYGYVRGDAYYNTRSSVAVLDGGYFLYPKSPDLDANGADINALPNGSMYAISTRLGLDVKGPKLGSAATSAKIETDFAGFAGSPTMLRLRLAYARLAWEHSSLVIGQAWHPLFGDVSPAVLDLNTGAPFQPFSRSPQVSYCYEQPRLKMTAAAIYQFMNVSVGPNGGSEDYMKNSCIPELVVDANYRNNGWIVGAAGEMLSLTPRTVSTYQGNRYKVNERITTFSAVGYLKYKQPNYSVAAKTIYGNNLSHLKQLGGFGATSVDDTTGEMEYTPFTVSSTWLNATYGTRYQVSIFAGYSKNLGSRDPLASASLVYGNATNMEQLSSTILSFSYNLPHWKLGGELSGTTAWYGAIDAPSGAIVASEPITNYRVRCVMMYMF